MPRRLPVLLACLALLAAACGDDEESVSSGSAARTTGETGTQATPPDAGGGCEKVEEPKPKDVGRVKRPTERLDPEKDWRAVIETSCGTLEIRLAASRAPKTVASFAGLARSGFYDGLPFHRVVPGFVVQGGDPKGTGEGGPGYSITEAPPEDLRYERGIVAMAKAATEAPGTSGSQFFIVTGEDAQLPPDYALVGSITGSDEALTRLDEVANDPADNRPTEPVVIEKITIRAA